MTELLLLLLKGVPNSLAVTFGAFAIGAVLAVPLVLMRRAASRAPRLLARAYIDVARGIPPIVWLFVIFFGLGTDVVTLGPLQAAVIGLALVSAAYIAEIYRGGFLSLAAGQGEAATALGMTRRDALRYVTAPQVAKVSIAPLATFLVSLFKDTAVASTIGVRDVMMYASQAAQSGGGGFGPFVMAAGLYILLSAPIAFLARTADRRLRQRSAR